MTPDTSQKAGRREWIGLAVIALPYLLYSMDLTVLYLAVPRRIVDSFPGGEDSRASGVSGQACVEVLGATWEGRGGRRAAKLGIGAAWKRM